MMLSHNEKLDDLKILQGRTGLVSDLIRLYILHIQLFLDPWMYPFIFCSYKKIKYSRSLQILKNKISCGCRCLAN